MDVPSGTVRGLTIGFLILTLLTMPDLALAQQNSKTDSDTRNRVFKDPFATGSSESGQVKIDLDDPLKPVNTRINWFNNRAFEYVGEPVARTYRDYVPNPVRNSVRRFFSNLYEPSYTVNSALQGEWRDAGISSRRFVINSTFGGAGFFNPAGEHLQQVSRNFDQTLGKWGISPGPYIVLPMFGPSSARGILGIAGDQMLDPVNYIHDGKTVLGVSTYRVISETSYELDRFESLEKYTVSPYAAIKDFYEKKLHEQSLE